MVKKDSRNIPSQTADEHVKRDEDLGRRPGTKPRTKHGDRNERAIRYSARTQSQKNESPLVSRPAATSSDTSYRIKGSRNGAPRESTQSPGRKIPPNGSPHGLAAIATAMANARASRPQTGNA